MKLIITTVLVAVIAFLLGASWKWGLNPFWALMPDLSAGETRVIQGPPTLSVAKLNELVSLKVRIGRVLSGQNNWYKGLWQIEGDAMFGIDCGQAEPVNVDTVSKTFTLRLPQPRVIMSRIDHDRTRLYDFRSHTWNPLRLIWGNPDEMRDESMKHAQEKLDDTASSDDYVVLAKQQAEQNLRCFYSALDWNLNIEWQPSAKSSGTGGSQRTEVPVVLARR